MKSPHNFYSSVLERTLTENYRNTRDFDTLGAAITFTYHLVEAPKYKGPVFLGIGDRK